MNSWADVKPGLLTDVGSVNVAERAYAESVLVVLLNVAVDVDELAARRHLEELSDLPESIIITEYLGGTSLNPTYRLFVEEKKLTTLLSFTPSFSLSLSQPKRLRLS